MNARRTLAIGAALGVALLFGCQVLVPSDLPEFSCASTDPGACPNGMVCDANLGRCITPSAVIDEDAGDAEDDGDGGTDARPDQDAGPAELGATCVVDGDCKSKLCGTSTVLTTAIVPTNSKPLCTQTCCTSADCAAGFVCFGAATGGNYCVRAERAQRDLPTSGGKGPGASCTKATDCRSGLCQSTRCVDTCCVASECGPGTTCRVKDLDVPPPNRLIWACAAPNGGAAKDTAISSTCNSTTECKNDNCVGFPTKRCTPSCCSNAQCASQGFAGYVCAYGTSGNDQLKWCFEPNSVADAGIGASCGGNMDCASRYCDVGSAKCAQPCCRDSDCPSNNLCRPSPVGTPYLRCVGR